MDEQREPQKDSSAAAGTSLLFDAIDVVVSAFVLGVLIFLFCFRTVGVFGSSMEQTLLEGDRLVISDLFYTPKQGDIVVVRKLSYKQDAIVKRVIAMEGQTVDIDFDAGVVYVDGVALDEPYTNTPTNVREDFSGPITVPEGCVFVMGDNRNRSSDSRTNAIGCVDTRLIVGRVLFRLLPFSKFGSVS